MTNEEMVKKIEKLLEYNYTKFQWNRVGESAMSFIVFVVLWVIAAKLLKVF